MPSIAYHGYQVHYVSVGSGPLLVFLHGWPNNHRLWQAQLDALSDRYRCVAIDWLGFGQSDKPIDNQYTFTQQVAILDRLLTTLLNDNEQLTLIGHDIGGPPAILWARTQPKRIQHLILLNTIAYTFKTPFDAFSEILFHTPGLRRILVSHFGLRSIIKTNTRSGDPTITQRIKHILDGHQHEATAIKWRTILDPMAHGRQHELQMISKIYQELAISKHLIIAKQDPLCFAHIDRLRQENPSVPVHHIAQCGHYIPIDRPEELTQLLKKILQPAL